MQTVQLGDQIQVHFKTSSREGGVLETSHGRAPLEFVVGSDEIIPGIHRSVLGMKVGEKKQVTLVPEETFGHRNSKHQQQVPRNMLPANLHNGDQVSINYENKQLDAWVVQIDNETALLDINHPLVGETLNYEVELVSILKEQAVAYQ